MCSSSLKKLLLLSAGMMFSSGLAFTQVSAPTADDKTYDFGLIPLGTEIRHTFVLKNNQGKSLTISKIMTSCGCTKITSFSSHIASGDQGEIVAVMNHQHSGYADISIFVQAGVKASDLYTFHLKGILVDKASSGAALNSSLITAQDVMNLQHGRQPVTLVDIRPTPLFVQNHIHGAQNLGSFALEGRGDLKLQSIILIDDGVTNNEELSRIDRLHKMGFKDVHLLDGGMRSWQQSGGLWEGAALPQSADLALLSPKDFYAQQNSSTHWVIVNIDPKPDAMPVAFSEVNVALGSDMKAFGSRLIAVLAEQPSLTRVLVVSSSGNGYEQVEPVVRKAKPSLSVYYLQGGTIGYVNYNRQQTMALASQKIVLNNDQAYLTSTHTAGQVIHGGGCSSCGH